MSKPHIHAQASAKRWGGVPADYEEIHEFMDSSKGAICDNRHRSLTHHSWFISVVLPRIFGNTITNSEGKLVSVRDIAEWHVYEDYGCKFIPTAQDFLQEIEFKEWMDNGKGAPPDSAKKLPQKPAGESNINTISFPTNGELFHWWFKGDGRMHNVSD